MQKHNLTSIYSAPSPRYTVFGYFKLFGGRAGLNNELTDVTHVQKNVIVQ